MWGRWLTRHWSCSCHHGGLYIVFVYTIMLLFRLNLFSLLLCTFHLSWIHWVNINYTHLCLSCELSVRHPCHVQQALANKAAGLVRPYALRTSRPRSCSLTGWGLRHTRGFWRSWGTHSRSSTSTSPGPPWPVAHFKRSWKIKVAGIWGFPSLIKSPHTGYSTRKLLWLKHYWIERKTTSKRFMSIHFAKLSPSLARLDWVSSIITVSVRPAVHPEKYLLVKPGSWHFVSTPR